VIPLPAGQALDRYFLDARCKLLEVAAILDRIDRGEGGTVVGTDSRLEKIHRALKTLQDGQLGRTARIQQIFSLDYEPGWERPQPR
jgi:hypothetical protein